MPEQATGSPLGGVEHRPGVTKPDPILVADGVQKHFGGVQAVDVEHLEIQRGVVTGLIGPNGAGKTTFFNVLSGFETPDAGTWSFDGRQMEDISAYRTARAGMVRTFQLTKTLGKMSVLDNMKLGATGQRGEGLLAGLLPFIWSDQERDIERRADALLERFELTRVRDDYAATLSGGQRKLLELARALMARPRLIMLDEPMAGVNPALTERLLDHVTGLPGRGMTVVFVEHDMDVVMSISDWVVCMAEGGIIAEGPPEAIARNPEVADAYLGRHHDEPERAGPGPGEEDAT